MDTTTPSAQGHRRERAAHEAALREAEGCFAKLLPRAASLLLTRARALDALGRSEEAHRAYFDLLRLDPRHFDALLGLAALLLRTGRRSAASKALAQAVEVRPDSADAHAKLATLLADSDEAAAHTHFERALRLDPDNGVAHRGLAVLLLRTGRATDAQRHARIGFRGRLESWPFRGEGQPVSVVLVQSALGGNVPLETLLDDRVFLRWSLAAEFFDPSCPLPPHDVVFNTVGDADRCGPSFDAVDAALAKTAAPIINRPALVRPTRRLENAERLARVPGVVVPLTSRLTRASLASPGAPQALAALGHQWPLLLRSPGFHTGENFVKVEAPDGLGAALAGLPGDELLALQFLDTRGDDGCYRKYRVMMIDGRLYPLHMAISPQWKVHYFSSDMAERADHRAEEEAFLRDMPAALGPQAMQALEGIRAQMGLDYGGIDFTLDPQGRVLVFEANATMIIVPPSPGKEWEYRVAPVERARVAVLRMVIERAGRTVDH